MRLLAVLLLLTAVAAASEQEFDVLRFKDGRVLKGFIVEESKKSVKFRIVRLGDKGQVTGGITARFPKAQIEKIDRASKKQREKVKDRSDAAASRPLDYEKALQQMLPAPVRFMGQDALRLTGKQFVVVSTCDERFLKEVAFYLEQVYEAYRENFGVHRNKSRKVTVYVLKNFDEYQRFQRLKFGDALENPALYYPPGNFIICCDLYPEAKAREIRTKIQKYERQIQEYKKEAKRREDKIRKEAIQIRRDIDAEARRAISKIRSDRYGDKNARVAKVERWQERQKAIVSRKEKELKKELKDYRAEASAYISRNRKALAHNYRLRLTHNKWMFECLFHEGFHAFSHNFLWSNGRRRVPRWIEEGLASYFEMSAVEVGELIHGGVHPSFSNMLQQRAGRLLPIKKILAGDPKLFLVAHRSETDRSNLYYAQSWAIAHYMMTKKVPQRRIIGYVHAVTNAGLDPVKAFERLMGEPIGTVESNVKKHLTALRARGG